MTLDRREVETLERVAAQVPGFLYQYVRYPDGRSAFPYASAKISDVYEVTPKDVEDDASPVLQRLHPEDRDAVLAAIGASAEKLTPWTQEYRVLLPSKGLRWVRGEATPHRRADGSVCWDGYLTDVTAQKLAQRAVRDGENRLRLAIEATGDGLWDWRVAENTVHHNSAWCAILQLDDSHLRHDVNGFLERLHPEDRPEVLERVQACLRGEGSYVSVHRMLRRDGSPVWVEDRGDVIERDASGGATRMIGSIRDISPRMAAEAERITALRKFESFFTLALDLMAITTLEGRFVRLNQSWQNVLGYDLCELEGQFFIDFVHPEDIAATTRVLADLTRSGEVSGFTNRYRHKDGGYRWIEWRASTHDGFAFAAARDVTERQEQQASLSAAKAAAERANEAKSRFLANMSHEIRTPMNGVLGAAELMISTDLSEEQNDLLRTIRCSGEALLAVINDILDFSRVESGRLAIEVIPFDLYALIADTAAPFILAAKGGPVAIRVEWSQELNHFRRGDPNRLRQIVTNLMGNAVKFTRRGEVVLRVHADADGIDDAVAIDIVDTGVGVSKDRGAALFEPFEQADTSTVRDFGGTGLGLTISRQLARLMGGNVTFVSELGVGSTFTVTLPLPCSGRAAPQPSTGPSPRSEPTGLAECAVLLVEDNLINQRVALKMLRQLGVEADLAENGREAVERARERRYDLILMDIQMPEMDGYAATAAIRAHEAEAGLRPVPIVALTANAMAMDRDQAIEAGMNAHLAKPVRVRDLEAQVRGCWNGREEAPAVAPARPLE